MSVHQCHARGCAISTPERYLMCRGHWFQVPAELRVRVWNAYRPGQEIDKRPSAEWHAAADAAIAALAEIEAGGGRVKRPLKPQQLDLFGGQP